MAQEVFEAMNNAKAGSRAEEFSVFSFRFPVKNKVNGEEKGKRKNCWEILVYLFYQKGPPDAL
jgi:hypothetical protein